MLSKEKRGKIINASREKGGISFSRGELRFCTVKALSVFFPTLEFDLQSPPPLKKLFSRQSSEEYLILQCYRYWVLAKKFILEPVPVLKFDIGVAIDKMLTITV